MMPCARIITDVRARNYASGPAYIAQVRARQPYASASISSPAITAIEVRATCRRIHAAARDAGEEEGARLAEAWTERCSCVRVPNSVAAPRASSVLDNAEYKSDLHRNVRVLASAFLETVRRSFVLLATATPAKSIGCRAHSSGLPRNMSCSAPCQRARAQGFCGICPSLSLISK